MLTTVAIFRDPWQAHLFRTRLEAEGLPAFVQFAHHVGVNWLICYALGGVRVQVAQDDVDNVHRIVRRIDAGEFRAELLELFGDLDDRNCPNCGSSHFRARQGVLRTALSLVVIAVTRFPLPPDTSKRRCLDCGTAWDA